MLKITFEYTDAMSNWQWRRQQCCFPSVAECKRIYGLGVDCDYRIVSVEKIGEEP